MVSGCVVFLRDFGLIFRPWRSAGRFRVQGLRIFEVGDATVANPIAAAAVGRGRPDDDGLVAEYTATGTD